jgi:hypothetical protein
MHAAPSPSAIQRRVSRLSLWLCLTVTWFAAHVLGRIAPHAANKMLIDYARIARTLLVAHALRHGAVSAHKRTPQAETRSPTVRRVAGPALRRALRQGSFRDRANAICAALAAPERWIKCIVRRLRLRFTKPGRLPAPSQTMAYLIARTRSMPAAAVNSS